MIRTNRMTFNEHGDPKVTITLEGWSDVAEGHKILRAIKRRLGSKSYRAYQEHLHGQVKHG